MQLSFGKQALRSRAKVLSLALGILAVVLSGCDGSAQPEIVGANGIDLRKERFFDIGTNWVTGIQQVRLGSDTEPEIAVFGSGMFVVQAGSGEQKVWIDTALPALNPSVLPRGENPFRILAGGGGFSNVGLMDEHGRVLWKYHPHPRLPPNGMFAADLDRDGRWEFYVAARDGLRRLDEAGQLVWHKERGAIVRDVAFVRNSVNAERMVACLLSDSELSFWDHRGTLIARVKPDTSFLGIESCEWPGPGYILGYAGNQIVIVDTDGRAVFRYKIRGVRWPPGASEIFGVRVVPARLAARVKDYLCVLVKLRAELRTSIFYVFSPNGELVHAETLGPSTGICSINGSGPGQQAVLVGDGSTVWRYSLGES